MNRENIWSLHSDFHSLEQSVTSWHIARSEELRLLRDAILQLHNKVDAITSRPGRQLLSEPDVEDLTARIADLSVTSQVYLKEHAILASLDFQQRTARHESIPEAHCATFRWLFERDTQSGNPENRFLHWLENGDGVFWVSGKPGCGKSTLMKYAADHPDTPKALCKWGSGKQVVLASHYFWAAGTGIQKSTEGLLRTLLYDILAKLPEYIPVVCTDRWQGPAGDSLKSQPWSGNQLRQALRSVARLQDLAVKFCFFIDGLDEYDGDHLDLCNNLSTLKESGHIKLCLSSRPWNVFEDSFGKPAEQKLYVHELTRQDIYNYAERRLRDHPQLQFLSGSDHFVLSLVDDIANRAQGVFLWVFLVIRQLREGLTNGDSFSDLRARLEAMPTDLDRFFKQILESVDPFYHMKMAETLRIALDSPIMLHTVLYAFQDLEYEDGRYALKPFHTYFPRGNDGMLDANGIMNKVRRQLNGRSKGLLEAGKRGVTAFLHRTVRDFLKTPEMEEFLVSRSRPDFVPTLSLARAQAVLVKAVFEGYSFRLTPKSDPLANSGLWSSIQKSTIMNLFRCLCNVTRTRAEEDRSQWVSELLDELENYFQTRTTSAEELERKRKHSNLKIKVRSDRGTWLLLLLCYGPEDYVVNKIRGDWDGYITLTDVLLLERTDSRMRTLYEDYWDEGTRLSALRCLLDAGRDPNERLYGNDDSTGPHTTVWSHFMLHTRPDPHSRSVQPLKLFSTVISLLLDHGADPNASLSGILPPHCRQAVYPAVPEETAWIRIFQTAFGGKGHGQILQQDHYQSFIAMIKRLKPAPASLIALTTIPSRSNPIWECICQGITWDPSSTGQPLDEYRKAAAYACFVLEVLSQLAAWDEEATLPWEDVEEPIGKASQLAEIPTAIREVIQRRRVSVGCKIDENANPKRSRERRGMSSATSAVPRKGSVRSHKRRRL